MICLSNSCLKAQIVIDQNYMDTVFVPGIAGNEHLAADGIRGLAIGAGTGFPAGGFNWEALGVAGSGGVAHTVYGGIHVFDDLVHANDHNDLFGAVANGCHPVGIAVQIHKYPVLRYRIAAAQEYIGSKGGKLHGPAILRGLGHIPVEYPVISAEDSFPQADFSYGYGAAPCDGGTFWNKVQGDFQSLLTVLCIIAGHISGSKALDDLLCQQAITGSYILIHDRYLQNFFIYYTIFF